MLSVWCMIILTLQTTHSDCNGDWTRTYRREAVHMDAWFCRDIGLSCRSGQNAWDSLARQQALLKLEALAASGGERLQVSKS